MSDYTYYAGAVMGSVFLSGAFMRWYLKSLEKRSYGPYSDLGDMLKTIGICGLHFIPIEQYQEITKQYPCQGSKNMILLTCIPALYALGYYSWKKMEKKI